MACGFELISSRWSACFNPLTVSFSTACSCFSVLQLQKLLEACLAALSVAVQHPAVAADQQNICRLLQVSKAVQAVVKRTQAGVIDISLSFNLEPQVSFKLFSFGTWLKRFPELVHSINITLRSPNLGPLDNPGIAQMAIRSAVKSGAQQLLEISLAAAAAETTPAAAEVAAGTAAAAARRPVFRPHSYSSNIPLTAGLLAAMPADNLTELTVVAPDTCWWVSGLSRLRNLREFSLSLTPRSKLPNEFVHNLMQLTLLTNLKLLWLDSAAARQLPQLPTQLQGLQLKFEVLKDMSLPADQPRPRALVNLQHLVRLRQLDLDISGKEVADECALPAQLQHLTVHASHPVIAPMGIPQLQQLETFYLDTQSEDTLTQLKALTQLQNFGLHCMLDNLGVDGEAAWKNLGSLRMLEVYHCELIGNEVQSLVQHVSETTQLTELGLIFDDCLGVGEGVKPSRLAICARLASLTQLRKLYLICEGDLRDLAVPLVELNAQYLSKLTGLTSLSLSRFSVGDTTTLASLASELTNLEHLELDQAAANLDPDALQELLRRVGGLTKLTSLTFHEKMFQRAEAQSGLLLLTRLTKLAELSGFEKAGDKALDAFWGTIKPEL